MEKLKSLNRSLISIIWFVPDFFFWNFVYLISKFKSPEEGTKGLLLVPSADLDGSFGDELMVTSFIHNFAEGEDVTILTQEANERSDFLSGFPRIAFQGGFYKHRYLSMLSVISGYSKVVVIGADVLGRPYSYYSSVKFLRLIRLANALSLETAICGFSISDSTRYLLKREFRSVAAATILKARDVETFKRLTSIVPRQRIMLTSDMGFICPKLPFSLGALESLNRFENWCDVAHSSGRLIMAICPNSLQAEWMGYQEYLKGMQLLIDAFSKHIDCAVVFMYHDIRIGKKGKSDMMLSADLFDHYRGREMPVYFETSVTNGVELKSYFDFVDFTVTGRMHFGISGIAAGKPMLGVCYANKFEGMLKLFEIDPDRNLIDYRKLADCSKVVSLFLSDFEENKSKIEKFLPQVKKKSFLNGTHSLAISFS